MKVTQWKRIFASYTSDKGLIFRICKNSKNKESKHKRYVWGKKGPGI